MCRCVVVGKVVSVDGYSPGMASQVALVVALETHGRWVGAQGNAVKGFTVPLGREVGQARAGTTVFVRVEDIYRVNFAGKRVKEPFSELERTIKFNVK